jgi:hypothetical protein
MQRTVARRFLPQAAGPGIPAPSASAAKGIRHNLAVFVKYSTGMIRSASYNAPGKQAHGMQQQPVRSLRCETPGQRFIARQIFRA